MAESCAASSSTALRSTCIVIAEHPARSELAHPVREAIKGVVGGHDDVPKHPARSELARARRAPPRAGVPEIKGSSKVIKGRQGSSRVVKGRQGSSRVIKGHQGLSRELTPAHR